MIGKQLKALRFKHSLTVADLCANLDMSTSTYTKYERDERDVNTDILTMFAQYYKVPTDYLLGRIPESDPIDNLPADEREKAILVAYLALNKDIRREIMETLEAAFLSMHNDSAEDKTVIQETAEQIRTILITFYPDTVSAGTGADLLPNDEPPQQIEVIATSEAEKASFAVCVSGDSMTPLYNDGDIILVRECSDIDVGEIGVFEMDGEGFAKEYGGDTLISCNPKYDPIQINKPLRCAGRVLGKAVLP